MSEMNVDFWRAIRSLAESLDADADLRAEFEADPAAVLRQRNIDMDVLVDTQGSSRALSDMLAGMSSEERDAALRSFTRLGDVRSRSCVVLPIVNVAVNANAVATVNVGVTANAMTSTNVNNNSNSNTDGEGGGTVYSALPLPLTLPDQFTQTEFSQQFSNLGLNPTRQRALLRQALTDPVGVRVIRTEFTPEGQRRIVQYSYRGVSFEVEGLLMDQSIQIIRVDVVD